MVYVKIPKNSGVGNSIKDFYLTLYEKRIKALTKRKYTITQAIAHIRAALSVVTQTFENYQLRKPKISEWQSEGVYEIYYQRWHFAVTVQYDIFGNITATVQDCRHDKDYHDDKMETKPFVMDNPNDQSHMVDWNERRLKSIVENVIRSYLRQNLLRS